MKSWISKTGQVYRIGEVIFVSNKFHIIVNILETKFSTKEIVSFRMKDGDLRMDGLYYFILSKNLYNLKKDYQRFYPDHIRKYWTNKMKLEHDDLDKNLDLEHEMSKILIPNNEDMFYCTRSNCCSIEKDFKKYSRQEYVDHINDVQYQLKTIKAINESDELDDLFIVKNLIVDFDKKNEKMVEYIEVHYPHIVQLVR